MSALRELRLAAAFLTRLPLRAPAAEPVELARSLAFFPLVGLGLGLLLAAVARVLEGRLPEALVAVIVVATLAAVTGALHLDGLGDVFDGFTGGRGDRERTLEIMRDSRIGGHGATALVLLLVAKVTAIAALLPQGNLRVLVLAPALGRWLAVLLVVAFPYARREGLGSAFSLYGGGRELGLATATVVAAALWTGASALLPALLAALAVVVFAAALGRRLGGLTGDAYGAAIELGEVAFLVLWLVR